MDKKLQIAIIKFRIAQSLNELRSVISSIKSNAEIAESLSNTIKPLENGILEVGNALNKIKE